MKLGNYSNMIISYYAWFSQNMRKNKINIRKEKVKIKKNIKIIELFYMLFEICKLFSSYVKRLNNLKILIVLFLLYFSY